ncbi:MAG TPA: hypothetical protein V6D12_22965 [Candidatus Obscuribacterales bacterium]
MMTAKPKVYCRLELFCIYDLEECKSLKKEKSLSVRDYNDLYTIEEYDVYVEEHQNYQSVINRIIELNNIWKKSELKRYWDE